MRTNSERGFSLLELMIGAVLTVGLMGAIFALVNRHQQVFLSETGTTDMSENIRTAIDLLTRDTQSAGMGLPRINGSFAAIFAKNGASGAPDSLLIVNGDPLAPDADVDAYDSATKKFTCVKPPEVKGTTTLTYAVGNVNKNIYKSSDARQYICYDDTRAEVFTLASDGALNGTQLTLTHSGTLSKPAATFGSAIDTGSPTYANTKICMLGPLIAYRLNTTTRELERTEDLTNWYPVARGIINLQIQYRVLVNPNANPPDAVIDAPDNSPTTRRQIRAVIFTITAETPDLLPTSKNYRLAVQQFEVTPRNFNLLNNTNLSANTESDWDAMN